MKKHLTSLLPAAALLASLTLCQADPLASFPGQITDKTPDWEFKPSKPQNGLTYNEFEGYYPDKGGKLFSKHIKLDKEPGKSAYYRIRFEAQAGEKSYTGINFFDAEGTMLPDLYDVLHAGDRRSYDRVFYAMENADSIEIFFQSNKGCQAWDLTLERATWEEAVAYCDAEYANLPPLNFTAPAGSMDQLPRTLDALKTGKPWRIVLLGDSIMQDTFHSQFHALVKKEFPASNLEWIISMRGSTGCWHYHSIENFKKYVMDKKPDLLIIGGISNYQSNAKPTGHEAMGIVGRAARDILGCEVLFMTGALCFDSRPWDKENPAAPIPAAPWAYENDEPAQRGTKPAELQKVASESNIPVWDMQTPCYTWLYASGLPHEFYSRDAVHSGGYGKQIIGRTALEYFKTGK